MAEEQNEIERIISKKTLAKNTMRTYRTSYKKLLEILATDKVADIEQSEIIELVGDEENYGSQNLLLTIAMMIKGDNDMNFSKINKHREIVRDEMKKNKWKVKDEKKDELPTVASLQKHLNLMYATDNYRAYIINFILINFNTRNLDLDLIVTDSISEYRQVGAKGDENAILAGKNSTTYYHRNNYKTARTYGAKTNKISNVKFSRALRAYIQQQKQINDGHAYLLALENGDRIARDSISHYITKYTYDGLTESDYNKIIVTEKIKSMDDYSKLKKISSNRGTAVETLIEEYNLDVKV